MLFTPSLITQNELYLKIGTYSGVAREFGCAPTTVKKYIIKDYVSQEQIKLREIPFYVDDIIEDFDTSIFHKHNWNTLLDLSTDEINEIKELWKELAI